MPDRKSIIEKIKALLAKTTANGCTEAEMFAALDKASAIMDTYDIRRTYVAFAIAVVRPRAAQAAEILKGRARPAFPRGSGLI
jgi:hypothetical protein